MWITMRASKLILGVVIMALTLIVRLKRTSATVAIDTTAKKAVAYVAGVFERVIDFFSMRDLCEKIIVWQKELISESIKVLSSVNKMASTDILFRFESLKNSIDNRFSVSIDTFKDVYRDIKCVAAKGELNCLEKKELISKYAGYYANLRDSKETVIKEAHKKIISYFSLNQNLKFDFGCGINATNAFVDSLDQLTLDLILRENFSVLISKIGRRLKTTIKMSAAKITINNIA